MAVTPADLLSYAETLIQDADEIRLRNGAGRAFYACFHVSQPLAARLGLAGQRRVGTHQGIIRAFEIYRGGPDENTAREVRLLGKIYREIRRLRSMADYEIGKNFSHSHARQSVDTARLLMARIAKLERMKLG